MSFVHCRLADGGGTEILTVLPIIYCVPSLKSVIFSLFQYRSVFIIKGLPDEDENTNKEKDDF